MNCIEKYEGRYDFGNSDAYVRMFVCRIAIYNLLNYRLMSHSGHLTWTYFAVIHAAVSYKLHGFDGLQVA